MDDWLVKPWNTFADKAIALRRAIGAEKHPVITREKHPQEWRDWYAYYGFRKMLASQDLMREKDEKTVPTVSPYDFDAEFNPSRPSPEVPNNKRESTAKITDEQRARHARLYPWFTGNSTFVPMPNEPKNDAA